MYGGAITNNQSIPPELVYHVYLQLYEAVSFLQNSKSKPIFKSDLSAVNIMLDPTRQDTPGYPNFVLIDFGNADENPKQRKLDFDKFNFYLAMYISLLFNHNCSQANISGTQAGRLFIEEFKEKKAKIELKDAGPPVCVHDAAFDDFVGVLKQRVAHDYGKKWDWSAVEDELENRLPRILKTKRDSASPEVLQKTDWLVKETMKEYKAGLLTDEEISSALFKKFSL